jgi:hypothetical protein
MMKSATVTTIKVEIADADAIAGIDLIWGQTCTVCGDRIEKRHVLDNVLAQAVDVEAWEPRKGPQRITVCGFCLQEDRLDAALEQHAARVIKAAEQQLAEAVKRAEYLRSLVGRLRVPTYAEYRARVDAIDPQIIASDSPRADIGGRAAFFTSETMFPKQVWRRRRPPHGRGRAGCVAGFFGVDGAANSRLVMFLPVSECTSISYTSPPNRNRGSRLRRR